MPLPTARSCKLIGPLTGILLFLAATLALFPSLLRGDGIATVSAGEPTPLPTSWISPDIYQPVVPDHPLLADKGAVKYWGVCMACHGDRGQGLTDEWRERAFGEDMNCWKSKCHAANHPPQGFSLVHFIPPVIGPNTLNRFTNAAQLHDYLLASMPWWSPGSLTSDEAWQLTAFLLREDGYYPYGREFNPKEAASISVHLPYRPQAANKTGEWVFTASLGAILLLAIAAQAGSWLRKPTSHLHSAGSFSPTEDPPSGAPAHPDPALVVDLAPPASTLPNTSTGSLTTPSRLTPAAASQALATPEITLQDLPSQPAHSRPSFLHHLHPPSLPLPQARFRFTLGTGGISVFLVLLLGFTGTLEMFFYIPTPQQAGASIQLITFLVPFGSLVRGLHFWAAQALVVVSAIHLLRILFTGAYAPPRRFNYLLGLGLFVVALLFDFTGYVLRWDEGIRWALQVGTNLVKSIPLAGARLYSALIGGTVPGLATLTRFYTWHTFGLSLILIVVLVWHLFRVRRDGGISAPPPALRPDPRRIPRSELVQRELLAMLVAGILLILVSLLLPAPLAPAIQTGSAPGQVLTTPLNEVRAPWFFLWVQQLLRYGNAFWLGVALPLAVLGLLAALPYLFPHLPDEQRGRWFPPAGRIVQIIGALLAVGWMLLTLLELATRTS